MGWDRVDNHRLLLLRDGNPDQDITDYVSQLMMQDELNGLSVEVTCRVLVSPYDRYLPRTLLRVGDPLKIVNHGAVIWRGQVEEIALDGQMRAYDRGWYLNQGGIIFQCSKVAADAAIKQLCARAGVSAGETPQLATQITDIWMGETPATILSDILDRCSAETGERYHYRMVDRALVIQKLPTAPIRAAHKPADNIPAFDVTWALGQVSGADSIADLRNHVIIAAEDKGKVYIGAQAQNAASIAKYGYLPHVETVTENPGTAKLGQMVKTMLDQYDRVDKTRRISQLWGADEVKSGVVLQFNSPAFGISGNYRVISVIHHYQDAGHTMELEIQAVEDARSADRQDTIQVHGLPKDLGAAGQVGVPTQGEIAGNATQSGHGSISNFLQTARGEIGYREGAGNRNKYGRWAGNDGAAWCVYFVCWCSSRAGAPIPTGYGYVGDMANYYKRRGKYRTVSSGYIPQPGDLMIQTDRHIGIVEKADRSSVQTIEGNYADSVRRVTRYYREITGFCTPWG